MNELITESSYYSNKSECQIIFYEELKSENAVFLEIYLANRHHRCFVNGVLYSDERKRFTFSSINCSHSSTVDHNYWDNQSAGVKDTFVNIYFLIGGVVTRWKDAAIRVGAWKSLLYQYNHLLQ